MTQARSAAVRAPSPPSRGQPLRPYVSALHAGCLLDDRSPTWRLVDGSLVFADVSGFTPLTERLSRAGKVGAEQLTETLNAVFSALLDVAEHLGGDCLKFGGDALLLLFQGPDHRRRAAAAAAGMQQALRALRRGGGSAGLSGLGISMGAHTGALHAFVVGSTHRELLVAGPVLTRTLELESRAERGQILLDAATAVGVPRGDLTSLDPSCALVRRRPALDLAADVGAAEAVGDVGAGVPAALRAHLDGERHAGEHRLAAVGFVKYGGVDALLAEQGPDVVASALDALVRSAQASCDDLGITFVASDVDADGGKLVLVAGVPSAADDDGDRLLLALHRVVDQARELPLRARAGANHGRIFAVDLGSDGRRTFTVMGDAVNLAARVMGHAAWGEVLATDDVLAGSRTDFHLERLAPFRVKGKSTTVHAQRVGAPLGSRRVELGGGPLVGRSAELEELLDALTSARAGTGSVVEIVGEPGIGKTRLVAAAVTAADDLGRLRVEAGRYSVASPYRALRRGLRELIGVDGESPPEVVEAALRRVVADRAPDQEPWIPLLGVPLDLDLPDSAATASIDARLRQPTLQRAWADLLSRLLPGPTLVTVEDAHWLDPASSGLLATVLARLPELPWSVVVSRRPTPGGLEVPDGAPVTRRHLAPLDRHQLRELATAEATVALPPGVVEQLVDRSGGNPLFLRELVRSWSGGALAELPQTIEAVLASQIDTLPPADRALLRQAAVLGGHVQLDLLADMVGEPAPRVAASVRRLEHFLDDRGDGTLRFSHSLIRDVAYEGLAYRTRRALHERAAELLEASTSSPDALAELLSLHFERAGRWDAAWRYSRLAAARAQRNGASVEAAGFLERALLVSEHLDVEAATRAEVAELIGDNWELAGRYDRASAAYRRARALVPHLAPDQARLCRKLGFVRDREGRFSTAQRWFRRGLAALDDVPDERLARSLRAQIATAMVSSRYRQGRHARAVPLIRQAIEDAEASGAEAELAHAYFVYDELLIDQGRYHEATHSERAASIFESLGDHRGAAAAYNEMGVAAYWLGRWDDAVRCYELAVEADRKAGALVYHAIYLNNIGEIRSDQGRLAEARQLLEEACELWTAGGWRAGTGWALSNLGRLAARSGRMDEARARLDEARVVLADIGADGMLLETDARVMERSVLLGEHGHALDLADELVDRARALDFPGVVAFVQRLEGWARCQAGDGDAALDLLRASLDASVARGAPFDAALAADAMARVLGRLGADPAVVEEHRRRAAEAFDRLGVVSVPEVPLP